jgi:cytochrome c556
MRMLLVLAAATGLAACNQSQPERDAPAAAPAASEPAGTLESRVNMAPVAPGKAKAVMNQRHEGMEQIGKLMKQLSRDMKSEPLNLNAVRPSAAKMDELARKAGNWFPAGTGPAVGKTEAKAEIWAKPQDFAAKMAAFQKASTAFHAAARAGNVDATKAAFGDVGKSCKACHDLYRAKKKG